MCIERWGKKEETEDVRARKIIWLSAVERSCAVGIRRNECICVHIPLCRLYGAMSWIFFFSFFSLYEDGEASGK